MSKLIPAGIPFTQVPNEAITDHDLDDHAFRIQAYLLMRANDESRAWPSQRTIEKDVKTSRNTVIRSLKLLRSLGWMSFILGGKSAAAPIEHKQRHIYIMNGTRSGAGDEPPVAREKNRRGKHTGSSPDTTGAGDEPEPARETRHNKTHEQDLEQDPLVNEPKTALRRRDLLWEAVVEIHGDPATDSERGKLNRAVGDLRKADVTPDEYAQLVAAFATKHSRQGQTPPQPTAITIATRIGELRHFLKRGPIGAPLGTLDDLARDQKRRQDVAALEAEYGPDGKKKQQRMEATQ